MIDHYTTALMPSRDSLKTSSDRSVYEGNIAFIVYFGIDTNTNSSMIFSAIAHRPPAEACRAQICSASSSVWWYWQYQNRTIVGGN
jgi:ribulose bisphosphate carboxylase small subunit